MTSRRRRLRMEALKSMDDNEKKLLGELLAILAGDAFDSGKNGCAVDTLERIIRERDRWKKAAESSITPDEWTASIIDLLRRERDEARNAERAATEAWKRLLAENGVARAERDEARAQFTAVADRAWDSGVRAAGLEAAHVEVRLRKRVDTLREALEDLCEQVRRGGPFDTWQARAALKETET